MRINRIYWPEKLQVGMTVSIEDDVAHRLMHVLRVKTNHKVFLFNEVNGEFLCIVQECSRHRVLLQVEEPNKTKDKESPLKITLVQGVSKTDKMDWAIQKAVELGVAEIMPIMTEYSHIKRKPEVMEGKKRHWEKVVLHAVEQCGRVTLPKIHSLQPLREWLPQSEGNLGIFLSPRSDITLKKMSEIHTPSSGVVHVLVGGEGGFSTEEENLLKAKGFTPICLGPRIMRTETATCAIIALLQHYWGDF